MDDVIKMIDLLGIPKTDKASNLLKENKNTLENKKKLLEEQLDLVNQKTYSAEKIFELNKNYGLQDNKH